MLTAADIPGQNKVGHLVKDWDTMIAVGDITHYLGDAICLVAAETPEILAQAKALVRGASLSRRRISKRWGCRSSPTGWRSAAWRALPRHRKRRRLPALLRGPATEDWSR